VSDLNLNRVGGFFQALRVVPKVVVMVVAGVGVAVLRVVVVLENGYTCINNEDLYL
jgi:uncharacterized membrane protein (Fun14 family)